MRSTAGAESGNPARRSGGNTRTNGKVELGDGLEEGREPVPSITISALEKREPQRFLRPARPMLHSDKVNHGNAHVLRPPRVLKAFLAPLKSTVVACRAVVIR